MMLDDIGHDGQIQFFIFMDQHIAETHHPPQFQIHFFGNFSRPAKQGKGVDAILGQAQFLALDPMIGDVDASLADSLQVDGDGVLPEIIPFERNIPVLRIIFPDLFVETKSYGKWQASALRFLIPNSG